MAQPASVRPDTTVVVDCYAADPRQGGHVLDPGYHGVHPVQLVSGAQVVFEAYNHAALVGLTLDFTNAGDPQGHLTGAVLVDREGLEQLAHTARHLRRHPEIGQVEIAVRDDGDDYVGDYGDGREPDVWRELHLGRTGYGAAVYLRLDLIETHGIAPTVWLDHDGLGEVAGYASDFAGSM